MNIRKDIQELLDACKPFVEAGSRIPATWRRDVPLQRQSNLGRMPTVGEYERLVGAFHLVNSSVQD